MQLGGHQVTFPKIDKNMISQPIGRISKAKQKCDLVTTKFYFYNNP
jgi:hypothetical protein